MLAEGGCSKRVAARRNIRTARAKGVVPWLQPVNEVVLRPHSRARRTEPNGHLDASGIIGCVVSIPFLPGLKVAGDGFGEVAGVTLSNVKDFVSLRRAYDIRAGLITQSNEPFSIPPRTAQWLPIVKDLHAMRCLRHATPPKARTARYLTQRTGAVTPRCRMASR